MKTTWFGHKTYYERWILPKFGLNSNNNIVDGLARYDGRRPVGNSPEFMPWDNSLNKDIDDDVLLHVLLTDGLKKGDNGTYPAAKYSLEMPKLGAHAYQRRIDPNILPTGSPTPSRIEDDVERAINSMATVYEHGGAMCAWLATRNGNCRTLKGNWGGPRVKKAAEVLIAEMEKRLGNIDPVVREVLEEDLYRVKKMCEEATLHLPEGRDLKEEEDALNN